MNKFSCSQNVLTPFRQAKNEERIPVTVEKLDNKKNYYLFDMSTLFIGQSTKNTVITI